MMAILANPSPIFQPALRIISAITKAQEAQVTTSFDHDYITGEIVRLLVPIDFGMWQINKLTGTITVTGSDTFTIDIDTTNFDTFSVPQGVNIGTTDAVTGNFTSSAVPGPFAVGQRFVIGSTTFTVVSIAPGAQAMVVTASSDATGTFNSATSTVTITGNDENPSTAVTFFSVNTNQHPQVEPIGEINSTLAAATKNTLPSGNR